MEWGVYFSVEVEKIKKKMIDKKPNKKIQELLIQAANYQKDNRLKELEQVLQKIIVVDSN